MSNEHRLPLLGDFGSQPVIGHFRSTLEDVYPTATHYGLVCDALIPNGSFRDDEGNLWVVMRTWDHRSTMGIRISSTRDGGKLYDLLPETSRSFRGTVIHYVKEDVHVAKGITPPHREIGGEMEGFSFRRTIKTVDWNEGSLLSINGRQIGPGLSWYAPDRKNGWMYSTHLYRGAGKILGTKVEGFFGYDQLWAPPGVNWLKMYNQRGLAWIAVGNEYEDGTLEVGHICYLKDKLRYAMIADENGPLICTSDVSVEIDLGEHEYPKVIRWFVNGEEWRWECAPGCEVGTPHKGIYRGIEGHCQKVGDTRKPKVWYAWGDFWGDGRSLPLLGKK